MNSRKSVLCAILAASMLSGPLAFAQGDSPYMNRGPNDQGQRGDDRDRRGNDARTDDAKATGAMPMATTDATNDARAVNAALAPTMATTVAIGCHTSTAPASTSSKTGAVTTSAHHRAATTGCSLVATTCWSRLPPASSCSCC